MMRYKVEVVFPTPKMDSTFYCNDLTETENYFFTVLKNLAEAKHSIYITMYKLDECNNYITVVAYNKHQ